jgi:hypothetical protein
MTLSTRLKIFRLTEQRLDVRAFKRLRRVYDGATAALYDAPRVVNQFLTQRSTLFTSVDANRNGESSAE